MASSGTTKLAGGEEPLLPARTGKGLPVRELCHWSRVVR